MAEDQCCAEIFEINQTECFRSDSKRGEIRKSCEAVWDEGERTPYPSRASPVERDGGASKGEILELSRLRIENQATTPGRFADLPGREKKKDGSPPTRCLLLLPPSALTERGLCY